MGVTRAVIVMALRFIAAHSTFQINPDTDQPAIAYKSSYDGTVQGGETTRDGLVTLDAATPDNVMGNSIVVHELTHWAQVRAGLFATTQRCVLEQQAYRMQADYLRSQNVNPALLAADTPVNREMLHSTDCNDPFGAQLIGK